MQPKVSVLMTVYNGERYLRQAVESILDQTFSDFEFIIMDDGSTDGTWNILSDYANRDQRIVLFPNKENIGLTKSLNKGLKLAQGEYIARQDADDISLPERFEKQVELLDKQPKVILVSASYEYIDSEGSSFQQLQRGDIPDLTTWYLLFYNRVGAHGIVMFRRKPVIDLGGYSENYPYSQDYELWSRLVRVSDIVILPDVLQLYRRNHSESISVRAKSKQEALALSTTRQNIKEVIGEELGHTEVAELKSFWLHTFPDSKRVGILNSNLKKIYRAFLQRHIQRSSDSSVLTCQLKHTIGRQFIRWIRSISMRRSLYSKLRVSSFAFGWYPRGVIHLWLSEIWSPFRPILHILLRQAELKDKL